LPINQLAIAGRKNKKNPAQNLTDIQKTPYICTASRNKVDNDRFCEAN
jgi:hypothetical protein